MKKAAPLMLLTVCLLFSTTEPIFPQVPSFSVDMTPGDVHELFTRDVFSDSALPAPFTSRDTTWPDATVRFKGNSTRYFAKKSYRVKFTSSDRYYGHRKINFNSMYTDKSLMREKLSWDLFAEMGTLAPTAEHASLSVAGDPKGLYVQIPKVDKYLLGVNSRQEAPMYDASDFYAAADLTVQPDSILKLYWEKEIGDEADYSDLGAMINAINSAPDPFFADSVRQYFDTTSVLQWFAGNALTMMEDSYNKNYLLYRDTSRPAGQWTIIPWDYDLSWGRTGDAAVPYPASLLNDGFAYTFSPISGPYNVLKDRYMADTVLMEVFRTYLSNVISTVFTEAHLWPRIDSLADLIRSGVAADPERWGTIEDFEEHVAALKYFVTARRNYLLKTLINPPSGEYNTATIPFAGANIPHHFVGFDGRLLGTLWFSGVAGLDSVRVTAHPNSMPPDIAPPFDARWVERWVEVVPYPPTAQFNARFRWAWSDVSSTDREVGSGVTDERLLRANYYDGAEFATLPGVVNAYANTVTIDSITAGQTGAGKYFAMMLSDTYARTWNRQTNNFWERWHDVQFTDSLHGFIVGEHGSFLRTTDAGDTWERDSIGSAVHFISVDMTASGRLITAGQVGSLYGSADTGRSWSPISINTTRNIRSVTILPGLGAVAGDSGSLFETRDDGSTWDMVALSGGEDFSDVVILPGGQIVACGNDLRIFEDSFILPAPGFSSYVPADTVSLAHTARSAASLGDRIWVAGDSGMVAFADGGDSAVTYRNLPVAANLNDITAIDSDKIFVAGERGVIYYTADAGMTWYRQLTGDTHDLEAIAFNGAGRGFAVGSGGTILRTDLPGTLTDVRGGDVPADMPTAIRLFQNYPNPFNPLPTIAFDLTAEAIVSLRIYDVLGRLVASMVEEGRTAGRNRVEWDASRFSSGVYFYRLTSSDRSGRVLNSDLMKMVLLR